MTQPTPPTPPQPGFPGGTEPFTPVSPEPFYTPPAPPARKSGGRVTGLNITTKYAQQASGSASDVAVGKRVIVNVNGRFDQDGQEGGSTASTVTVVP